jgi:ABC-type uncharacterized transport system YnjBCD permease subunit
MHLRRLKMYSVVSTPIVVAKRSYCLGLLQNTGIVGSNPTRSRYVGSVHVLFVLAYVVLFCVPWDGTFSLLQSPKNV